MASKHKWTTCYLYSLPPTVGTKSAPHACDIIEQMEDNGWEFVALIPGRDDAIPELRDPPQALFKKERA